MDSNACDEEVPQPGGESERPPRDGQTALGHREILVGTTNNNGYDLHITLHAATITRLVTFIRHDEKNGRTGTWPGHAGPDSPDIIVRVVAPQGDEVGQ
jgi:hypothetical protein